MELDCGTPLRIAGDLYLLPSDSPGARQSLQCLIDGFLGRNPGCRMAGCVGPGAQVLPLPIREEAGHRVLALVGQQGPDPFQIHQIDSHPDHGHRWAHQNSASGRHASGTGR